MRTYIVYIPGLGSRYNRLRQIALNFWRIYGVSTQLLAIDWYDGNSFERKMDKVKSMIAEAPPYSRVVVIGESAGATLALHAAPLPGVTRVVTLCGVTQPATPISSFLQDKSPSFVQATRALPNTSNKDVHSIRAWIDPVVGKKFSTATGAKSYTFWTVGHLVTIVISLTILASLMVTIAKKSKT